MGFVWVAAGLVALYLLGLALGFGEHVSALSGAGPLDVGDRLKGLGYILFYTMLVVVAPVLMIAAGFLVCAGTVLRRALPPRGGAADEGGP
jgi:hypothetical protein